MYGPGGTIMCRESSTIKSVEIAFIILSFSPSPRHHTTRLEPVTEVEKRHRGFYAQVVRRAFQDRQVSYLSVLVGRRDDVSELALRGFYIPNIIA